MTFCWSISPARLIPMHYLHASFTFHACWYSFQFLSFGNTFAFWMRGLVVKLISKTSSCVRPIAHSWNSRRDWVCPPKTTPENSASTRKTKELAILRCFLGWFWVDRPSLSVSFRSGQLWATDIQQTQKWSSLQHRGEYHKCINGLVSIRRLPLLGADP